MIFTCAMVCVVRVVELPLSIVDTGIELRSSGLCDKPLYLLSLPNCLISFCTSCFIVRAFFFFLICKKEYKIALPTLKKSIHLRMYTNDLELSIYLIFSWESA
jgi:hypothetical protein